MRSLDTFSVEARYAESEKEIPKTRRVAINSKKNGVHSLVLNSAVRRWTSLERGLRISLQF